MFNSTTFGWAMLAMLVLLVTVAVVTRAKWPTALAIVACLAAVGAREFSIVAVARGKIQSQMATGTILPGYRAGIMDIQSFIWRSSTYTLLGTAGLAIMAAAFYERSRNTRKQR